MNEISMIGLDLAKNVFQVHGVDASGKVVLQRRLRRGAVERFFANPGRISKQGDRALRTLLINGASAHLRQQMRRGVSDPWLRELLARRPYKGAMVAFAAKTARIIWAMLAKGEAYRDRTSASAAA